MKPVTITIRRSPAALRLSIREQQRTLIIALLFYLVEIGWSVWASPTAEAIAKILTYFRARQVTQLAPPRPLRRHRERVEAYALLPH